jgi:hypothetical protein
MKVWQSSQNCEQSRRTVGALINDVVLAEPGGSRSRAAVPRRTSTWPSIRTGLRCLPHRVSNTGLSKLKARG